MENSSSIAGKRDGWFGTILYGFAHLGKSLFWYSSELLFAFFLTEFVLLPAEQMGVVLATGFLAAAFIDISTGAFFKTKLSDPHLASKLQMVGSMACSIALILVLLAAWLPVEIRFGYSLAAGLLFRACYAIYDVPQNALMALATQDRESRLRLASTRIWFSGIATIIVSAAVAPMVSRHDMLAQPHFLFWLSAGFAATAILTSWLLFRFLRASASGTHPPAARSDPRTFVGRFRFPFDFWLLLIAMFAASLFTPLFSKLEPYFATYVLQSAWWGGIVVMSMAIGLVAGQPFWPAVCRRLSHGGAMVLTAFIQIAGLAGFWLAGANVPAMSALAAFVFGLGNGGVGMVQWAAFSETVARMGSARAGISYGLFTATAKLAQAAGGLLLGLTLAGIDLEGPNAGLLTTLIAVLTGLGAVCAALIGGIMHFWSKQKLTGPTTVF